MDITSARYASDYTATPTNNANIDVNSLRIIAVYLEGIKIGKGSLHPLGLHDLEQLWNAVNYFQNIKIDRFG